MENISNKKNVDSVRQILSKKTKHDNLDDIKNILIVNSLNDLIIQCNIDIYMLTQIYIPAYIFSQIKGNNTQITILDENIRDYSSLWEQDSAPFSFINQFISEQSLANTSLLNYDLILFNQRHEFELLSKFASEIDQNDDKGYDDFPLFLALFDTNEKSRPCAFANINSFLNELRFDSSEFEKIKTFKQELLANYKGFNTLQQESLYQNLIERIVELNSARINQDFKRILLLDDQKRKFFIGDTYFWFQNIRKNILSAYPEALVTVNCRSREKIEKIRNIFDDNFDPRIEITDKSFEDLNYHDFDLVLCENDSVVSLFAYIVAHDNRFFEHISLYSYVNVFIKRVSEYSTLNYKYLYDHRIAQLDPISLMIQNKRHAEIRISEMERNWAADWLDRNGLKPYETLNILVFNASVRSKMLTDTMAFELVNIFGSQKSVKVLLFDENNEGLSLKLKNVLDYDVWKHVIVFEGRGLREAMSLIAHYQVKLVMGPCTGVLHLANGVYQYKLNQKTLKRSQLPELIVYTGNWKELQRYYHPKHWWTGTLIKCLVYSQSEGLPEGKFEDLALFNDEVESYCKLSLPLEQVTGNVFKSYFDARLPHFSLTIKDHSIQLI